MSTPLATNITGTSLSNTVYSSGQTVQSVVTHLSDSTPRKYTSIKGNMILVGNNGAEVDVNELAALIPIIKARLLILDGQFELHEQYPALKEAYDNYTMIARLIDGDHSAGINQP